MTGKETFEYLTSQLAPATDAVPSDTSAAANGLHVCEECGSKLVYPVDCERYSKICCRLTLRCPSCNSQREGLFTIGRVDELEQEYRRGRAQLEDDLARITRANMAEYVDRFVYALEADRVLPVDF